MSHHVPVFLLVAGLILAPACAQAQDKVDLTGKYECKGTNPDGTAYTGTVTIVKKGDTYLLEWSLSDGSSHKGVGLVAGGHLSSCWQPGGGGGGIVVYKIEKGDKGPKLVGQYVAYPGEGKLYTETLNFKEK